MKNRKRNRLLGYDYSRDNLYFVTICVNNRKCCLGSVDAAGHPARAEFHAAGAGRDLPVLNLNKYGLIVKERILWLENQYEYVKIHNYVVMPNHVHIVIEINRQFLSSKEVKIKTLSSLMGALKTTSSKLIHLSGFLDFSWQRSFHDRIIRSRQEFLRIANYIDSNPENWNKDSFSQKG